MDKTNIPPNPHKNYKQRTRPVVSVAVPQNSVRLEIVFDPSTHTTAFVLWEHGNVRLVDQYRSPDGDVLVPYSPNNNLIKHHVVLLPSEPVEYGTEAELLEAIQAFIHRYVDISPRFERVAAHYVLFTWVYDAFNEVPYLRLRGDYGSGKTRFLLTVGSLCYAPIFASGASTMSPIFHTLNAFRGTLVMDEGDFRFSDEKSDIIKMLNNGTVRGLPVLRTEISREREFNPRAFEVFGPKIVATRGSYEDRALESRFITEDMGHARLRSDIPINMPMAYKAEALALRNKLLLFRLRTVDSRKANPALVDPMIEPRLNQMFVPLLSVVEREDIRAELRALAREYQRSIVTDRGFDVEAQLLRVVRTLFADATGPHVSIKDVTAAFSERFGGDYEGAVTNRWIGTLLYRRLRIQTQKSHGVSVIPRTERPKIDQLCERFGIADAEPHRSGETGEFGETSGMSAAA